MRNFQIKYSTRGKPLFGLCDGEGVERLWSYLGRFNNITKNSKAEHRIDLLTAALYFYSTKLASKIGTGDLKKTILIQ